MNHVLCVTQVQAQDMRALTDSIVKYQMASGGWPKNQNWLRGADSAYMEECRRTGVGSTIDNGATTSELKVLASVLDSDSASLYPEHRVKCMTAFVRGIQYLLNMQYDNGGWRQFFPQRSAESYANHITFNDDAMVNVMRLLWNVANRRDDVGKVELSETMRQGCRIAFWKGVECILACQIRDKDGVATVWCQQHDENTLQPASARKYELASYSGFGETVGIVTMLMDLVDEKPDYSGTRVTEVMLRESVHNAVAWLEAHAIHDMVLETYVNEDGKRDKRLVPSSGAPLLWARFYDLERGKPLYSDRRGMPLKSFNDIQYERRNGYSWIGNSPQRVIDRMKGW